MQRRPEFDIVIGPLVKNAPEEPGPSAPSARKLMVELDERRRAALAGAGKRLFDFGLGDPKEPTPPFPREALRAAVPEVSQYPSAVRHARARAPRPGISRGGSA